MNCDDRYAEEQKRYKAENRRAMCRLNNDWSNTHEHKDSTEVLIIRDKPGDGTVNGSRYFSNFRFFLIGKLKAFTASRSGSNLWQTGDAHVAGNEHAHLSLQTQTHGVLQLGQRRGGLVVIARHPDVLNTRNELLSGKQYG